jgi:hypothetical protein
MNKRWVIAVAIGVVALWIGTPWLLSIIYPEMSERGQFGDMFGAVNALFSGLALLGAIYAIMQQSEELALQREELALTRKERRILEH